MNKRTFMSKLKKELHELSEEEIRDILKDFEEHFNIGQAKGKTEADIALELGSPVFLAQNYLENNNGAPLVTTQDKALADKTTNVGHARVFVVLFNALLSWWLALIALFLLYRFWKTSVLLAIGGITSLSTIPTSSAVWHSTLILFGISLCAFAVASGIINYFITKWSVIGTIKYIKWNKRIYHEGF